MSWAFVRDIAFHALLGLLAFVPLVYLVAAFMAKSFEEARTAVKEFLNRWAAIAPSDLWDKLFNLAGISTVLLLLGFVAYGFNRLGDATMPYTSAVVGHFGNDRVQWSVENPDDAWNEVRFQFREVTGIRGDRLKWEQAKAELGRFDVRFFRTVFFFFLLLIVAGIRDSVSHRKFLRRGIGLTVVGVLGLVISQWLWIERQGKYVENLVSRYESEYLAQTCDAPIDRVAEECEQAPMPNSYPGS